MTRLTDADRLFGELCDHLEEDEDTERAWVDIEAIVQVFNHAPTVDAVSVRQGKWIPCMKDSRGCTDMFQCSECKRYSYYAYGVKRLDYEYCPHCGAKMDAERKEE